jgi:hypothetical protein
LLLKYLCISFICPEADMPKTIVSLTTIPPRFDKIGQTLRDLTRQNAQIDEIRLNISKTYRRFPGELPSLPEVPEGVKIVMCDQDFGPATKVLPTVQATRGTDSNILFCDDDQPYEPEWAANLLAAAKQHPKTCIVGKGYDLDTRPLGHRYKVTNAPMPRALKRHKGVGYRLQRLLTGFTTKPRAYVADGYVDILEGYRGALVRPDFFPDEVFDIPDILWTVDDPWLSGHLTRNGIPIWFLSSAKTYARPYQAHFADRLGKYVYKDHGRLKADTACIDYFRETYGIWQGFKETPETAPKTDLRHFFGRPVPLGPADQTDFATP